MNNLKDIKLYLLDMDGTLYLDDNLFDGVKDFLKYIRDIGGKYIFMTNNSSKSVEKYIEKMSMLGIKTEKDNFLTSTDATALYLKNKHYKKIYAFGTDSFKKQLICEGLSITDKLEEGIDCICMGFDTELSFQKLEDACILLNKDIDYVATNPDWVCPTRYGFVPDCGSVSEMIFRATKRRPVFIGKPKPIMAELAMKKTGFTKEETVVVGDRLYTDIACGVNAGTGTIFVLSGEGTMEDVAESNIKPQFIFKNVKELVEVLNKIT